MTAEEVLAQHIYSPLTYQCSCVGEDGNTTSITDHAAHQLDALKAAGFKVINIEEFRSNRVVVVELPKPGIAPTGWGDDCLGAWPVERGIDPVSAWPNGKVVTPDDKWMSPEAARSLATALLAAADAADAVEVVS